MLFIFLFSFIFSHEAATWLSNDHLGKDYASLSGIHEIRVRTGAIKRGEKNDNKITVDGTSSDIPLITLLLLDPKLGARLA